MRYSDHTWNEDTQYALCPASADDVIRLQDMDVPKPDNSVIGFPVYRVRADLTRVADGHLQCSWIWNTIARTSLYKLLAAVGITGATTYAHVKIYTDDRSGTTPSPEFKLYTAVMYAPNLTGDDGSMIVKSPYMLQSTRVIFNKLVEVVD